MGGDDGPQVGDEASSLRDYYEAFTGVLASVQASDNRAVGIGSSLRHLSEEVEARSADEVVAAEPRGRRFYTALQETEDGPLRGLGLLSREEVDGVTKLQRKEDAVITAGLQGGDGGGDGNVPPPSSGVGTATLGHTCIEPTVRVEEGPYTSYVGAALAVSREWTLNELQSMAVLLPALFLDERGPRLQDVQGRQHLQYVGGEGGTGKSRIISAIKEMFRQKDALHTVLVTAASGNAAALVGGVTLHSATGLGFEGELAAPRAVPERVKLR